MNLGGRVRDLVGVTVLALVLAGCSVETATAPSPDPASAASTPSAAPSSTPTPTQATWPYDAQREEALQTQIAQWPHPVPEGYAWPASWSDIPFHGGVIRQQLAYINASGIYHCMMVGAAWDAYFTDDDPDASTRYGGLADEFLPDDEAPLRVMNDDGTIEAQSLASESGICRGFVGDLTR